MDMNRRQFFRVSGAGLVGSSLVALGFSPTAALAETRNYKLARTTETRNTCPYCSVAAGIIMYSLGDKAKNVTADIIHIEGRPGSPGQSRHAVPERCRPARLRAQPEPAQVPRGSRARQQGMERIGWDEALNRIAKLMKADRDANFIAKNAAGQTVNRWLSSGMLCASASFQRNRLHHAQGDALAGAARLRHQARV